jgi:outer membrane protein
MVINRPACWLLVLGIGLGSPAIAQDSVKQQPPAVWDLNACLNYAKKNNIQINSSRLTVQTNQQNLLQSRAARQPNLSGSVSQSLINSKNTNPVVGGFQTQASYSSNFALASTSWIIYSGGAINEDIRQKGLDVQSAQLNVLEQENDITLQITQAYLNILLAKENIVYVQDLLKTSQAQQDQGKQRYDAGSIALKDFVELQAQTSTDKYNLVQAQNTERQNLLTLKQVLQLPSDTTFDIVSPDTLIATALVPPLSQVQQTAMQTRPEIKNGELGVQIAQLDLAKAKAAFLPVATVNAALQTGYSDNQAIAYLKQLDNNFYQAIGLNLSIPIFTKRVNKTNLENSKIEISQAQLTLKNTRTTLSQAVEQAYISVLNSQAQYDAAVEQLKANQESFRIATEQLKVGVFSMVDFLTQKNLYVQALQAYVQAKYNAALSMRIYDFYMGVPVKL